MTQEQKAKAYDEALERASCIKDRVLIEYIFPELAESEDEKIRKAILGLTFIDGIEPILEKCAITRSHIRTWLEKQKIVDFDSIPIDKMVYKYANSKEKNNEEFGKPLNCMVRAYRQGIEDTLNILDGNERF